MSKQAVLAITIPLLITILILCSLSCSQSADISDELRELEERIEDLEQELGVSSQDTVSDPSPGESYETELHNIQTAVLAMLVDSESARLDADLTSIEDMDLVTADGGAYVLSRYMAGLNADGTVKSGCKYDFAMDGTVTQRSPFAPIQNPQDYETELHNIQTAVLAMLVDSPSGQITAGWGTPTNDMDTITTDDGTIVLSDHITGLNPDGTVTSGCTYIFTQGGAVTQITP
ncbi:MAG TPA: hypothetical protein G4O10_07695 [Dehalococcoidia bacterium]|nr:hypothetical protein [Dehalococcoidia bacterium]